MSASAYRKKVSLIVFENICSQGKVHDLHSTDVEILPVSRWYRLASALVSCNGEDFYTIVVSKILRNIYSYTFFLV